MAEEKVESRDGNWDRWLSWTVLFRGFQVALDPKKLLLAAAGLLTMAIGWWLLAVFFYGFRQDPPQWDSGKYQSGDWQAFKEDRHKWNLLSEAAGPEARLTDLNDLAETKEEFEDYKDPFNKWMEQKGAGVLAGGRPVTVLLEKKNDTTGRVEKAKAFTVGPKPFGKMRTLPWFEDRGPNPYLIVTGRAGPPGQPGSARYAPWLKGEFFDWLINKQIPVLIEPLVKFLRPITFLLRAHIGFWNWVYFVLVLIWTLATWALFGGAITRMAAVQLARKDKIGMTEAIRFTLARYLSYFSAPIFPLIFVLIIVVLLMVFGGVQAIPYFGDIIVDGLAWPLVLLAGVVMAVILVGLVGWPMMYATISTEGSDSFDALSRSYSYVFQAAWHYLWYAIVAVAYGAAVVFFIGLMGSLLVYLGKWGVSQTPGVEATSRDPARLFVYAPESFHWRALLLSGTTVDGQNVVQNGVIVPSVFDQYSGNLKWYHLWGAFLVAIWLYVVFLLMVGFGYSYFWSASTIIYLLMRRKVDDTELDEVYLEEDESEQAYSVSPPSPAPSPPAGPEPGVTMVEAPSLRTPPPTTAPAEPAGAVEGTPPAKSDGNPPAEGATA